MKKKKARVEDALNASRAAVEEGIVHGGGVAFLRCQPALSELKPPNHDEELGLNIIRRALEEPIRQIATNAGAEGSVVAEHVKAEKGAMGFNAETGVYEDPDGGRRHRPHQDGSLRSPECLLGGLLAHHHRSHGGRET
jgi:chaperonin GroEL